MPKYPLLEGALLDFMIEKRDKTENVSGKSIRRKAASLFPGIYPDIPNFKASTGCLRNFLRRNNLVNRVVTGVGQQIP